ncbi:uncharacterized protein [Apostichopus japonicus]|uniref:uncharacterized protein isoform X4 n=1 Tax=Stichopus japonicus TaxID=307972 RepID=UPI003AB31A2B
MDLFTCTPVKSEEKLERFHVSNKNEDEGIAFSSREKLADDDDSIDYQRRSMEADLANTFQSRSLDSSLYTTYNDLSAFLTDSLEEPTPGTPSGGERSSTADSPTLNNSPSYSSRQTFDVESLALLKSKTVNRSLESILYELEQTFKNAENQTENPDDDFQSAPLQHSRSMDSLQLSSQEADDSAIANQHVCRADGNKLNFNGLNDDILVQKDDTLHDRELTGLAGYNGSLLAVGIGDERTRRFGNNGITPASGVVTNHESADAHYDSEAPYSTELGSFLYSTGIASFTTSARVANNDSSDVDRISLGINECIPSPEIRETSESSFRPPVSDGSKVEEDVAKSKMASDSKEKRKLRGGQGEPMATENDLMTVIEALRREAASWEEKYQELKQRRSSQSEEAKDFLEELKSRDANDVVGELQFRLRETEINLVDAREEIEELKEEIDDLKLELEEASDRVREGDLEEFRDLKHDLDQVTKECRILQYRLRKSDRKLEQVEQDKAELEAKLRIVLETPVSIQSTTSDGGVSGDANQSGSEKASASSNAGTSDEEDKAMEKEIANLKQQLKVAKDVSVRLHQELEMIEEKRARTEEDNQLLRNRLLDSESARKDLRRDLEKTKLELHRTEVEFLRRKIAKSEAEGSSQSMKEKVLVLRSSTSSEDDATAEYDIAALLNDLQESTDRERDLQSQLQLVEEEGEVLRKSLADVEQEKETIDFELERYKMRFGTLDDPKKSEKEKGVTSEKEAELRLQLMVIEQEATVMRRKLVEKEVKNEELEGALARLSERLPDEDDGAANLPTRQTPIGEESNISSADPEGAMDKDSSTLRQQIASLEQENGTLRMKITAFEEAESFIKSSVSKISRTVNDSGVTRLSSIDFENIIDSLKRRLVETEFRNRCYELEIQTLKRLNEVACMPRDTPSKPAGRPKSVESKIRGQLALMHNEADTMRRKLISLEMANERLQEEVDQKGSENLTSGGERLGALQDKIIQLEEELGDLLTILRSKEISETQQIQEFQQLRDNYEKLHLEAESREQDFRRKLSEIEYKKEVLEQQLKIVKERAESMQGHLKRLCAGSSEGKSGEDSVSDDVFVDKKENSPEKQALEVEKIFNERVISLEHELAMERLRVSSLQREAVDRTLNQTCQQLMSPSGDECEKELLSFELDESRFEIEDLKDEMTKAQESLQRKVENITDMNEELKVSNDLLVRERVRLQEQLSLVEKQRLREETKNKQDRVTMDSSLSELRRMSDREQSELKRALQDLQSEVDRLSAEKEILEAKEIELNINVENLSKLFEEAEAAGEDSINKLKRAELVLEQQDKDFQERLEKAVDINNEEWKSAIQTKDQELKSRLEEIENLKSKNGKLEKEIQSLKKSHTKEREKETTQKTNTKAAWTSEKSKLQADVTSLSKKLAMKEDSSKAERAKYLKEVNELRQKIKENEGSSLKLNKDLESRLEAATELVESYKSGESRFMEERKRLLKQIEEKDLNAKKLQSDMSKLSQDHVGLEENKKDYEKRLNRQEKVWKNELSVYRFKLEAETRYFTEELGRLQKRLECETTDYSSLKGQMNVKEDECQRLKALLENSQKYCKELKLEQEKDSLAAKRTRQLLDDVQREKREVNIQLASQRSRCEMLQRGIASDKAAWQVTHTELQARITRLEQQTKLKKVKLEDLQTRLQTAWDQERAENMRLLTEANQKILQLESHVQEAEEKRQLDATTVREGYRREQKSWEEEGAKYAVKIRERDQDILAYKDRDRKYTQIDERFQRERDLWRRERSNLISRLQESLECRKEDMAKLDELILQLNSLKETTDISSSTSSPIRAKSTPPLSSKQRKEVGVSWPLKKQPSESHIPISSKDEEDDAFKKTALTTPTPSTTTDHDRSASEYDVPLSSSTRQGWMEKSRSLEESPHQSRIEINVKSALLGTKKPDLVKPLVEKRTVSKTSTVRHESKNSPSKESSTPSPSRTYQKSVTVKTVKTVTLQPLQQGVDNRTKGVSLTRVPDVLDTGSKDVTDKIINDSTQSDSNHLKNEQTVIDTDYSMEKNGSVIGAVNGESTPRDPAILKLDVKQRDASKPSTIEHQKDIGKDTNGSRSPVTPLEVKSGRFDAKSFLRETEKKTSPNLRNTSPAKHEIQKRLEEMEKSLVTSTKKIFEQEGKTPAKTSGSRVSSTSPSTGSPARSDSDSERDRHTDTDIVMRINRGLPTPGSETMPKRGSLPSSSDRITRGVERNRSWSPRTSDTPTPPKTSPGTSPSTQSPRYPIAPPGFLLPKQIKTPPSSNTSSPSISAPVNPPHPKPKPYNVPIAPSELAAFNEAPMKVLPGQLSKTKGAIQSRKKQQDGQSSNSPESPPTSPQRALAAVIAEDRAKRISPRSARANFFADIPGTTAGLQSTPVATVPPNGNNNYVTKSKDSNANTTKADSGVTVKESASKPSNINRLGPPSRASPWSANPGASISKSGAKGKGEQQGRKGSGGVSVSGSKPSKPR